MFFMGRRDSTGVVYDILRLAQADVSRSQIVHQGNLNFKLAARYVSYLTDRGVLQTCLANNRTKKYKLTAKGERLLGLLSHLDRELNHDSPKRATSKLQPHPNFLPESSQVEIPEINETRKNRGGEARDQLRKLRPFLTHLLGFLVGVGLGYSLP